MRRDFAALLLCVGLVAAPWFGGRLSLEPQLMDGTLANLFSRDFPAGGHMLIAVLILAALVAALSRRSVVQLPSPPTLFAMFGFWAVIAASLTTSEHRYTSLLAFSNWTLAVLTLIAVTVICGRERLPWTALSCIFFGISLVALSGIWEYMQTVSTAPNWRIFTGWQSPNAAAAVFAVSIPLGISLVTASQERLEKMLFSLGSGVCSLALWLTASKGGLMAAFIGIVATVLALMANKAKIRRVTAGVALPLVSFVVLLALVTLAGKAATGGTLPTSRLAASGSEAEQSVAFRYRLWQDTTKMALSKPVLGSGIGTFAEEFPKYSTTAGSKLAHNSYLQLAAEAGAVCLGLFLLLGLSWLYYVLRRHHGAPARNNIIKAGIVGGVIAGAANAFVESSFSFIGFSVLIFALLGLGLMLSADGAMPERAPLWSRAIAGILPSILVLWLAFGNAVSSHYVASGLEHIGQSDFTDARDDFEAAQAWTPSNPAPATHLGRLALAAGDAEGAVRHLRTAADLSPTAPRHVHLAQAYEMSGDVEASRQEFRNAILADPRNPARLRAYFDFAIRNDERPLAAELAQQLVLSEDSDYVKFTALPQFVNTDSVEARVFLADISSDKADEALHLQAAFDILAQYRRKTYVEIKRITQGRDELADFPLAGETLREARDKFDRLVEIGDRLAKVYRELGKPEEAEAVLSVVSELAEL